MCIIVSKSKGIISGLQSLNKQSARLGFKQCSSETTTLKLENDLFSTINEMKASMKKMQNDLEQLQNASANPLKNVELLQKTEIVDLKKAADATKVMSVIAAAIAAALAAAYWLGSELQDKPSRSDLKEEFALVRADLKEEFALVRADLKEEFALVRAEIRGSGKRTIDTLRESEKRTIDTLSKDWRLALMETEMRLLKSQHNKETVQ